MGLGFKPKVIVNTIWKHKKYFADTHAVLTIRLQVIGEITRVAVIRNISKPTGTLGPSRPGEFPHADTGLLKRSIFWKVFRRGQFIPGGGRETGGSVIIGTPLDYGFFLERGTKHMAARPYLKPTLDQIMPKVRAIMLKKMN